MVDDMLRRTAEKSVRYAGERVVPERLDAERRHLSFYDSQWQFTEPNFVPGWSRLQLVYLSNGVQSGQL